MVLFNSSLLAYSSLYSSVQVSSQANMGVAEYNVAESPQSELDEPYGAEKLRLDGGLNPFPEAVVVDPVLAGRRPHGGAFDNESFESYYEPCEKFEGRHRYDPKFEWDKREEQRVVRKCDLKVTTWVCLMFFALQLGSWSMVFHVLLIG